MAHSRNYENANEGMVNWRMRDKITCLLNKNWLVKEWLSRQLAPRDGWHNGYVLSQIRVAYGESYGHYLANR